MELKEVLIKRRSIRKYTEEPVSDEEIRQILEAAMSGPSACNVRPWEFYVVTSPEMLKKFRACTPRTNYNAPLAIVPVGNNRMTYDERLKAFWVQDLSAAAENMLLRATDLGLGGVWCGVWPVQARIDEMKEFLGLGDECEPLGLFYFGHPAEEPEPRTQYDEERVHYIR